MIVLKSKYARRTTLKVSALKVSVLKRSVLYNFFNKMFVSINDAADISIPPENKNRYTSPFT